MSRLHALSMRETHSGGARQFQRVMSNATTSSFAECATFEVLASSAGCVTAMALEPVEGRVLLTTDTRSVVRLYDGDVAAGHLNSGGGRPLCPTPLASYCHYTYAHSRAITTCAWYPRDGGLFVTGGADGCCVVWDPGLRDGRGGGGITPVSKMDLFPPSTYSNPSSSSSSAAAAASGTSGGGGGRVHSVSMSPCASTHALVAVGTEAPGVRLLDLATGAAIHSLPGHTDAVMTVAWCPFNEHLLASGARDGVLLLHDVRRSGSLSILAALDAHTVERQWLDYIGRGGSTGGGGGGGGGGAGAGIGGVKRGEVQQQQQQAGGLPSLPKLPASARASLGIAFRGERDESSSSSGGGGGGWRQQQQQEGGGNNPSRDATHAPSVAHAGKLGSGVNGLLWISPSSAAAVSGGASHSKTAQYHLLSTGGDSEVRLWGLTGVESSSAPLHASIPSSTSSSSSTYLDDPGNLITHRGISGVAGWNTLKTFPGVKNCAKRCIGMAGTAGVVGGGEGGGGGGLGGTLVPPRVLKMEGGQGGEVWDTRERWGRGCGRDLLFHPIILPKVSSNTTAAAANGGGAGNNRGGAVRFVSGRLNGGGSGSGGGGSSGGGDLGGIGVWDATSGESLGRLRGGHLANVSALVWAGGLGWGGTLFSGGDDGLVLRWRVETVASGGGGGPPINRLWRLTRRRRRSRRGSRRSGGGGGLLSICAYKGVRRLGENQGDPFSDTFSYSFVLHYIH